MSSYIEASANSQDVGNGVNFVFDTDPDSLDIAGADIAIDASGTVFTINKAGLYCVEWSVNLASGNQPMIVCLLENGRPSSAASNTLGSGNYSSGALIQVSGNELPFTISLHNFGAQLSIRDPNYFAGTAASIRILRFADGPNN